ncbi:unnamed protein product [Medioppia subpectinata]|uniref:Large ribosomal subunit protein P2 n=1 Tax=Medioppia subpectinata TaxID=1979941 RepID=A0A7R9L1R2_9ACAR|nr:unnamed protein product [Medioppia subpectinata]CAG2113670.1 unnamed protein product [Medioppia subpectinata]
MRYVSAYLLATIGGNKSPSAADIKRILSSVGIEVDDDKSAKVVKELSGKSIDEIIAKGTEKLASVPSGGGAAVAAAAPAAGGAADSPKKDAKKEKKEESEEEEDEDMGFGLFD